MNSTQRLLPLLLSAVVASASGCSGDSTDDMPGTCEYSDPAGADCASCQQLGQCCDYSINCPAGAICNVEDDALFDSTKAQNTCLKVVCEGDTDCDAPKTCSLEKLCKPPICQTDGQCPGGQKCLSGECQPGPNVDDVTECEVVSRSTALRQGATLELSAVARNSNSVIQPGIEFDWTSANPGVVAVEGNLATGGAEQGTTQLTASVRGKPAVTCSGSVSITNFPNVPQGMARVVLVADDDGSPVTGAMVVFEAGGTLEGTSDATGSVTVATAAAIDSVTAIKEGWQFVSVLSPGTNDIFIPVPRIPDETKAGGFRGKVDVSDAPPGDIRLGIAGPAIPSNLLDFGLDALIGDSVPTTIDAPELGLDNEMVDLPGGVMLGLGNKTFTDDTTSASGPVRCRDGAVGTDEIGCFLSRAPKGPAAGWVLAGRLKLSDVTSIANELSNALGGGGTEDINIGSILTAVLPLVRSLNHGITASLDIEEFAKVPTAGGAGDCSDPNLPMYDTNCQADFSKYQRADMDASASLGVLSRVSIPNLPQLPGGGGCAAGAILLSGVNLEGRGLVPLGLTAGIDVLDEEAADCKVAGVEKPFGDNSPDLPDGVMPLSMAPPHSGVEGSQLFLLLLALDPDSIAADTGFQLSAIVNRVDAVGEDQSITGSYLPYPKATVSKANNAVTMETALAGAGLVRVELQDGDDTWLVYAPGNATAINLPAVARARQIVANLNDAYVLGLGLDGTYGDVWTFGSGKTLNRMFDTAESFVIQQCASAAGSPCLIQ
jgi:hypothetical protein